MAAIWVALAYYNQKTQDQYNDILQRYLRMNEVTNASQEMITSLNTYRLAPTPSNLELMNASKQNILRAKIVVFSLQNAENASL